MESSETSDLFQDLTNVSKSNADTTNDTEDINGPTEVESFCVNCGKNGITTLLLARIPHYREIILSSFMCESCGFKNNDIQSGGVVQSRGIIYKVCIQE
jgi:zinc finger protein